MRTFDCFIHDTETYTSSPLLFYSMRCRIMWFILAIVLLLTCTCHEFMTLTANGGITNVTATFGTNIQGSVILQNNILQIDSDLSKLINGTNSTSGNNLLPKDCFVGGLRYSIKTQWNYNDTSDRLGPIACGSVYTGGDYDQWIACSSNSANGYCHINGGCVNGSSALSNSDANQHEEYHCNMSVFQLNPYACAVGDWSGKYGYLNINSISKKAHSIHNVTTWEILPKDLVGLPIVFKCHDNTRAFCSPFVKNNHNGYLPSIKQS